MKPDYKIYECPKNKPGYVGNKPRYAGNKLWEYSE